ncbi:MAG: hypothetical protein AAF840_18495, partial [Bacteroidota bacterium]
HGGEQGRGDTKQGVVKAGRETGHRGENSSEGGNQRRGGKQRADGATQRKTTPSGAPQRPEAQDTPWGQINP